MPARLNPILDEFRFFCHNRPPPMNAPPLALFQTARLHTKPGGCPERSVPELVSQRTKQKSGALRLVSQSAKRLHGGLQVDSQRAKRLHGGHSVRSQMAKRGRDGREAGSSERMRRSALAVAWCGLDRARAWSRAFGAAFECGQGGPIRGAFEIVHQKDVSVACAGGLRASQTMHVMR